MLTKDFYFDLPDELIAQEPSSERGDDRLLVLDKTSGEYMDSMMKDFPSFLDKDTIMVVNNSKVRKARTYGTSETGGVVEFLFLGKNSDGTWKAMVTKSKKQRVGKRYAFSTLKGEYYTNAEIVRENADNTRDVRFSSQIDEDFFLSCGHVPLPPYIKRDDNFQDETRYQTIYAKKEGSVAAPTAGLHFTPELLDKVKAMGIEVVEVTLHVGAGTFLPVRTENLEDHHMHTESYEISKEVADKLNKAKKEGRRIIAVGTTSTRTLETIMNLYGEFKACSGWTEIFIYPGFEFKGIDALITNFHLPKSTLVMLVSAFAGKEKIMNAYNEAVKNKYRFFSFGDSMFIK